MASCIRNILAKNYLNLIIGFQVTVKNVGDVLLRHSVLPLSILNINRSQARQDFPKCTF